MKASLRNWASVLKRLYSILILTLAVGAMTYPVSAQSSDQNLPTAVLATEINGTISALDVGDSRLTRHYYAFEATPGDLIVTVNSRNLNGDIDVFRAVSFRPLTKVTIYQGITAAEVSKSLYFRNREILILRIEARTPNDDPGTYRITFGGSFQPFSGGIPVAENTPSETEPDKPGERNAQRLSSVGATIPRPPGEIVEETKPEVVAEKPAEEKPVTPPAPRSTARTNPRRTNRGRTPPRTTRPAPPRTEGARIEPPKTEAEQPKTEEAKPTSTPTEEAKPEEKPANERPSIQTGGGARLVIEQTDGTRIERPMSGIRRVIVESNAIVIVSRAGRIERIAMSSVARMAIEP
jgi:hypothetical protein